MDRPFTLPNRRARAFLGRVMATRENEIDCGAVLDVLGQYVEIVASGQPLPGGLADVPDHLRICADCADLVATAAHLARLEAEGRLPELDELWEDLRDTAMFSHASSPSVGHVAAPPSGRGEPAPIAATRRALRQRTVFDRARLAPAALSVAAVVALSFAWWGTDRVRSEAASNVRQAEARARVLDAELQLRESQDSALLEAIAAAEVIRFHRLADGSWMRLFFSPDRPRAVLVVGDLEAVDDDDRLSCWLKRNGGPQILAIAIDGVTPKLDWWLIEGKQPLGDYDVLEMTVEPEGRALFQVAIAPESGAAR